MTVAARPSRRVRLSARRPFPSRQRRILKPVALGLLGGVVILAMLAVAILGTSRFLAGSQAGSLLAGPLATPRVATAAPPNAFAVLARPSTGRLPPAVFIADATTFGAEPVSFAALRRQAPDPDITGSVAPAPLQVASADAVIALPRIDEAPLPRSRPRLAALPPAGLPGITGDDELTPRTAIYDITAKTVYLPSGEKLEAHSGLGAMMDDPRHTRVKDRGATPPNVYKLKLRESLFHGVQAIRLTPLDERAMYGRDGILAHSYMLGSSGQSNGCVSFKDYSRFLQAFLRGEVDRMIVVTGLERPPAMARGPIRNARTTQLSSDAISVTY